MQRYTLENQDAFIKYVLEKGYEKFIDGGDWKQFRSCQAWYCTMEFVNSNGEFELVYILQSYNTIVAVYHAETGELVRLGKWSTTTSKQTTQWGHFMDREMELKRWRLGYGLN